MTENTLQKLRGGVDTVNIVSFNFKNLEKTESHWVYYWGGEIQKAKLTITRKTQQKTFIIYVASRRNDTLQIKDFFR